MPKIKEVFDCKENLELLAALGYDLDGDVESPHPTTGGFLLHEMVFKNEEDIVDRLIKHGADINKIDEHCGTFRRGQTPLLLAIAENHQNLIKKFLLEYKADPSVCSSTGHSPLMLATMRGNVEAVDLLLCESVNIDHENTSVDPTEHCWSAILYGAYLSHGEVISSLIERGSKIVNSQNETAFDYANQYMQEEIAQKIEQCMMETHEIQTYLSQTLSSVGVTKKDALAAENIVDLVCSYTPGFSFIKGQEGFTIPSLFANPTVLKLLQQPKALSVTSVISSQNLQVDALQSSSAKIMVAIASPKSTSTQAPFAKMKISEKSQKDHKYEGLIKPQQEQWSNPVFVKQKQNSRRARHQRKSLVQSLSIKV